MRPRSAPVISDHGPRQSAARRLDGCIDVGRTGLGNLGNDVFRRGIEGRKARAARRFAPLAIDQKPGRRNCKGC